MKNLWIMLVALSVAAVTLASAQDGPRIDVVFLLDATGSMGDEIDAVKEKIRDMISDIALGEPAPDVRFGLVAYRDRGDEYVTRAYALTRDIDRVVDDLDRIEAGGGGDTPESLNEGLHVALNDMAWDESAVGLVFLIADAPPHMDYAVDFDWRDEVQIAAARGIAVHTIGASGLDEEGEQIFRDIAAGTQGQFQWLVYESRYTDTDGGEVIVRVEGREAVYTKGDSTWTVEGGFVPVGGGGRGGVLYADATTEDGGGSVPTTADGGADTDVSTETNLDDLITATIKAAAVETGVDYDGTTVIQTSSWGEVKVQAGRR
ncbi:MAG: VWA domain-containing protein [Gemmatimonadetes bacterium]|nr:VWA domain-containing protein [Gemmatimonadota bacterium]